MILELERRAALNFSRSVFVTRLTFEMWSVFDEKHVQKQLCSVVTWSVLSFWCHLSDQKSRKKPRRPHNKTRPFIPTRGMRMQVKWFWGIFRGISTAIGNPETHMKGRWSGGIFSDLIRALSCPRLLSSIEIEKWRRDAQRSRVIIPSKRRGNINIWRTSWPKVRMTSSPFLAVL